jgi:hypothetical protein
MRRSLLLFLVGSVAAVASGFALAASLADVQPPGKYYHLKADAHKNTPTFKKGQPIVGTTYFYWYDVYSGAHFRNANGSDAMTTHPPESSMADLSYKSPNWHYSQLRDMAEAGLDFFMPVYWGTPGNYDGWSFAGLPPLVQAHDRMTAEHRADASIPLPPQIGLFYDTSTLMVDDSGDRHPDGKIDLTTPLGRDWFYATIRDFFSMIPPAKWARIDGRPIIFLYSATFAATVDEKLFDDARQRFKKDFATDFFLIRHTDWPGKADGWYIWGGALGLKLGDIVAALGPGYDHSAVPNREPLVVNRRGGAFYREQWERLLRMRPGRRPWMVHVETWNEWHEGTDIARSKDWGVRFIEMTARYARLFREGSRLPAAGPYINADQVRWSAREVGGLTLKPGAGDGWWKLTTLDGRRAAITVAGPEPNAGRFLYFDIDDSFMFDEADRAAEVSVVFRDDGGCDWLRIDYDNVDPDNGAMGGAFRAARPIPIGRTGTWRVVTLQLPDVRFCNRAHGADFRIDALGGKQELTIAEVTVRRLPGKVMDLPTTPVSAQSQPTYPPR